ncbi:peptide chain release factor N(5)-glutamine methyltransferase [Jiangella asiatica]|uniref:Release factor glutamine methyltransferase n=1 Tax=Jiangella asiatica TaxID=2530372 RepID=A0A4R5DVH1_9ACTN|nr:peptide chain release factor N(5)-glutamine methyltransferase [Jiangella asiatica]TDE15023.1 peptide chain release factor N(5)-glutamine methyltransferase [Jiangella asiatica]
MSALSLREQLRAAADRLTTAEVPSPRHDAEVLAAHVLGVERGELITQPEPDAEFTARFDELVRRRADRIPLQHLTGQAHFRHVTLRVGPGVFIPRPETELTAGVAVDEARALVEAGRVPVVVDLFAGSGAIAVSVATEVRPSMVHAVEREDDAVTWLRRNAAGNSIIVHRDDVALVAQRSLSMLLGQVDIVTANPPYVPAAADIRDPEVAEHDPPAALWSGDDGLDAMRMLADVAARLLRPGGLLVAEHADMQGEAAPEVFRRHAAWTEVADHLDLAGRPRYVTARRAALETPVK